MQLLSLLPDPTIRDTRIHSVLHDVRGGRVLDINTRQTDRYLSVSLILCRGMYSESLHVDTKARERGLFAGTPDNQVFFSFSSFFLYPGSPEVRGLRRSSLLLFPTSRAPSQPRAADLIV